MTVRDSRRTNRRVYRIGLAVSAGWLAATGVFVAAFTRALSSVDASDTLLESVQVFDDHEPQLVGSAVTACALFVARVAMFLQWPDARLIWRSWRR